MSEVRILSGVPKERDRLGSRAYPEPIFCVLLSAVRRPRRNIGAGHANVQTMVRCDRSGEADRRKAASLFHVPHTRRG